MCWKLNLPVFWSIPGLPIFTDPKHPSIARWELTPTESGTHVKMTHSGLAAELEARQDYSGGWPGVLEEIKTSAESESGEHKMTTTIVTPDQDAIVSEIQIAAPPERVFKAISHAGELERWFTGPECPVKFWNMDARVGGRYSYATEKGSIAVNGVQAFECQGEILE